MALSVVDVETMTYEDCFAELDALELTRDASGACSDGDCTAAERDARVILVSEKLAQLMKSESR